MNAGFWVLGSGLMAKMGLAVSPDCEGVGETLRSLVRPAERKLPRRSSIREGVGETLRSLVRPDAAEWSSQ